MAKPLIPVGTARAAVNGVYGPTTWANVYYVEVGETASTPGEVIAQIVSWFHDLYSVAFHLTDFAPGWATTWTTVTYRDADDSIVRVRVADAQSGDASSDENPAQAAYLVNWSTGDIRRGGKPRQYICGVADENLADSAKLTSTALGLINPRLITWLESGPSLPIPLQLIEMSFVNGGVDRAAAATFPIIGASLNPVLGTQRRRVDRVRPS